MKLQSARKLFLFLLANLFLSSVSASVLVSTAFAEGTRTWEQSKFDELTRGTAKGVAIRSMGGLELAPTFKSLYATPSTYIWAMAADEAGNLYVATGDHGEIFRVTPKGEHSVFFKSDETHIRVLAFDALENLIAGSDGSGLIYRISPAGEGFVLYSAPKKEITALALDRAGNIYAAAVGEKRGGGSSSSSGTVSALITLPSGPSSSSSAPQVQGITL